MRVKIDSKLLSAFIYSKASYVRYVNEIAFGKVENHTVIFTDTVNELIINSIPLVESVYLTILVVIRILNQKKKCRSDSEKGKRVYSVSRIKSVVYENDMTVI